MDVYLISSVMCNMFLMYMLGVVFCFDKYEWFKYGICLNLVMFDVYWN